MYSSEDLERFYFQYQTEALPHGESLQSFCLKNKLSGPGPYDRETGGLMLSVTGLNRFYYVRDFTDMRCKHSRILSVIRERLHREPQDGDVYIVMSRDRRIVKIINIK